MEQTKPLTLRRNFSWTFIGNVVYAACQWGLLVVMAKLGSAEMVGQFTLGLAITAPTIALTNLQLRSLQATDAKRQYLFGDYLALRLISTGFALLLIVLITFAVGYRWKTLFIILLIGLAKAFESISDIFYGLIQQHERMDRIAMSMIIKGTLSLLLLSLGIYTTGNLLWGIFGLVVAWAIVLITYDIRSGALMLNGSPTILQGEISGSRYLPVVLRPRWNLKTQEELIWLSLPLGVVMMVISLNSNIPRYFVERYLGERELGFFAAIAYLMVAGSIVVNALGESANPRLAKYYAAGDSAAFRSLIFKLLLIGALLGGTGVLISLVVGRQILALLYQPEYAKYTDLFVWLMLATAISYVSSLLGYGMTAAKYFRIQIPIFTLVTTISAMACFWLIPTMGLLGAAIALLLAAIVQVVMSAGVITYALYKLKKHQYTKS
ncbi:oligosaccharide flippase family protein [Scytonema sp. UIC 10036]|uniref:oligosaccharide flippase family protein n=1 Tax=Scytonema sp. UIC 10036 TaxID=2304196 RepID=UPI0012DAF55C|nr:oligosaccharide flippase family protein [Scytonema sp. UIC 10036]MUG92468.1 oligosaccharide flippase family protein [Scytonema sp. UIC 10036]